MTLETGPPWISRLLSKLGHGVIIAHARKVPLIGENRKKDDRLDAQSLAWLTGIRSRNGCMATAPNSAGETLEREKQERIHLSPTGLLMEGDFTQNASSNER